MDVFLSCHALTEGLAIKASRMGPTRAQIHSFSHNFIHPHVIFISTPVPLNFVNDSNFSCQTIKIHVIGQSAGITRNALSSEASAFFRDFFSTLHRAMTHVSDEDSCHWSICWHLSSNVMMNLS